jgi:type IV secretion system protein VirB10
MKLPPLGRVSPPQVKSSATPDSPPSSTGWGSAPPLPSSVPVTTVPIVYRATPANTSGVAATPVDRRLTGPVLAYEELSGSGPGSGMPSATMARREAAMTSVAAPAGNSGLGALLQPTATPATIAGVVPTLRLLLPKGAFVDCTLETAIDSSLQGLVTCITPADVFGADGTTVLLERGTKLVGETRGEVRQGQARVYVLWSEARTPTGVVARLDSPGTDELGRTGLPGHVERHFFERFGAAMLVTVIEGAIQRISQPGDGGTVILNPSATSSIATEALKGTVNIPPTILKQNGDRIQVLVARDIDFRSVYELRPAAAR